MKTGLIAGIVILSLAAGCGRISESRLNPLNWFGNSRAEATTLIPEDGGFGLPDTSVQIAALTAMKVDRMPGGAIVTAEGVAPTQGFWEPELVEADAQEAGALIFDFRVQRPYAQQPAGAVATRTISAGVFVSDLQLQGVRRIIVRGADTQRVARR